MTLDEILSADADYQAWTRKIDEETRQLREQEAEDQAFAAAIAHCEEFEGWLS